MILLILYHKNRNGADFFNIFYFYFTKKKRGVHMANKTKKLFVRVLSGVMAGLLLLGCVAMLAII